MLTLPTGPQAQLQPLHSKGARARTRRTWRWPSYSRMRRKRKPAGLVAAMAIRRRIPILPVPRVPLPQSLQELTMAAKVRRTVGPTWLRHQLHEPGGEPLA